MPDPTESIRRHRLAEINADPGSRQALKEQHGRVWDTQELSDEFEVLGFLAPYVVVRPTVFGTPILIFALEFPRWPVRSSDRWSDSFLDHDKSVLVFGDDALLRANAR